MPAEARISFSYLQTGEQNASRVAKSCRRNELVVLVGRSHLFRLRTRCIDLSNHMAKGPFLNLRHQCRSCYSRGDWILAGTGIGQSARWFTIAHAYARATDNFWLTRNYHRCIRDGLA